MAITNFTNPYVVEDEGGRPIQLNAFPGSNQFTSDSLDNNYDQDLNFSEGNGSDQFKIVAYPSDSSTDPGPYMTLYCATTGEGLPVTVESSMQSLWIINDDYSIQLVDDSTTDKYYLTSLDPSSMNQLVVSKKTPVQTWTFNKKVQKGGPHY